MRYEPGDTLLFTAFLNQEISPVELLVPDSSCQLAFADGLFIDTTGNIVSVHGVDQILVFTSQSQSASAILAPRVWPSLFLRMRPGDSLTWKVKFFG